MHCFAEVSVYGELVGWEEEECMCRDVQQGKDESAGRMIIGVSEFR